MIENFNLTLQIPYSRLWSLKYFLFLYITYLQMCFILRLISTFLFPPPISSTQIQDVIYWLRIQFYLGFCRFLLNDAY